MTSQDTVPVDSWSYELEERLAQLRDQTITFALLGLCVVGLVLLGSITRPFLPSLQSLLSAGILLALALATWFVRRWSYLVAAWLLVVGSTVVLLIVFAWSDYDPLFCLLALPVGLAALVISVPVGVVTAIVFSLALLFTPSPFVSVDVALRTVSVIGVWGTLGMVWLTLNPLLRAVQWAWSGYEQSRDALEQARDYQQQLHETLEDLTAANAQLTQLNRIAHALRQTAEGERQAKERFVANVSHELRTPLNMIIGFCEMITDAPETYGGGLSLTLLADLDVVLRNSQHLSSLIDDVLDLSQIEAGQMALTKERVSLPEIVQTSITAVRPLFDSKSLYLETEISPDLPPVFCDRTRIREVMLNLLSNAGRFTEAGGVQVRVWRETNRVVVSVADTGPGIGEERRQKLFQPFQQLDATIRRRFGGTGLGLSISRSFVEMHEGKMWVESQEGRGTTFFFRLPIDPPVPLDDDFMRWFSPYHQYERRTRPSRVQPVPLRPRFVIVEHGDVMVRLFSRYLDGADFVSVPSLEEAVEALSAAPTQALLINDLNVGDVLQRLSEAVKLPYGIPAIVCSIPGVEQATNGLGVAGYLVKPVSRDALLAALDKLGHNVETVMIVDDEPNALQLFRRMLASAERGYRVLRATNGRQALEMMRQQSPDVVLLDLAMPEMDGFQFLAIKGQDPTWRSVPVILVSARDPLGHPIVSDALAVTCANGLSVRQIVDSVRALSSVLATAPSADPTQTAAPSG